ncbi:oxidase [Streptomyces lunaelactis]|uniref:Oxidase n=1 Tax=Streptomyces lunaelactis TaxID=1535768 RepID=A0A2R4T1Y7_9ACTN|nr:flavin reductase family protein [Streptomyces lunaelactis]AVZ73104.1 oxidase [Streptomyces lunaelactis]NUK03894.1 flavin reductase family protein [Streptomyces lunaelactis]NUK10795.1 flavin reductase family protein [Streptomyces lunaelactis]NUK18918.1 flavin reductase family protein [Streptomyces lunaelactis]NUK26334.1 flavin reductase family protein [Streptomyces lunaelactis]
MRHVNGDRTGTAVLRGPGAEPGAEENGGTSLAFRDFMSSYFTGVSIVTAVDPSGRPHGLTCSSLTSVTLSPPTLQVCLESRSGTLAALRAQGTFAVNLLHQGGTGTASVFASTRPDRFERTAWRPTPTYGLPWLHDDAYAVAECEIAETVVIGDHVAVFGRVMSVENGVGRPLLYGRRGFLGLHPTEAAEVRGAEAGSR